MKILGLIGALVLVNALGIFRWFLLDNVRLKPKVFAIILASLNLLLIVLFIIAL